MNYLIGVLILLTVGVVVLAALSISGRDSRWEEKPPQNATPPQTPLRSPTANDSPSGTVLGVSPTKAHTGAVDGGKRVFCTKREEILAEASRLISNDREKQYGSPAANFSLVGRLWREYLDTDKPILAHDVSVMMTLFKIARIATGGKKDDNYIDACGYLGIAGELKEDDR